MPKSSTTWGKGKSGNPSGRPAADKEIQQLALANSLEAFAMIVSLAKYSDDEKIRLSAAEKIIDRAYGKAPQTIVNDISENIINYISDKPLTPEEWAAKYARKA
jgi:hypothetical protein